MTRRAKSAWLTALVTCVVVAGLLLGPDLIDGITYSRFKPVYPIKVYGAWEWTPKMLEQWLSASYREALKRVLIDRGIPHEVRDGVLYVRDREWRDKELMARITWSTGHPDWPKDSVIRDGVKLLPLYPERSILAETALFRERPARYVMYGLECVFSYYGLKVWLREDHIFVPELVLRNAAFLRFAAAKAGDAEWLAYARARHKDCISWSRTIAFGDDDELVPGQPWPQYSADELIRILKDYGFSRRYYWSYPRYGLSVSRGLCREPEVLALLVSGTAAEQP